MSIAIISWGEEGLRLLKTTKTPPKDHREPMRNEDQTAITGQVLKKLLLVEAEEEVDGGYSV